MKHVIVIGAGIIGAASAFFLTRAGCRVTVIDEGDIGGIASRASFGWLNASFHLDEAHFRLRMAGMDAHRALGAELPGYHHWPGCLWFEEKGEAAATFAARLSKLGYPANAVTQEQLQRRWPHLSHVTEATFLPLEGAIETSALAQALLRSSGADVWSGLEVAELWQTGGAVSGVRLATGHLAADAVVVAAGVGSARLLGQVGMHLPMLARPGALVVTRPVAPLTDTLLCGPMGEVRQLPDGRILIPTSPGHQGDDSEALSATPGELAAAALARLGDAFPSQPFAAETVRVANRPVPGDGLPVLDRVVPGLIVAVMHSGATLAALAGKAVADLASEGECDPLWRSYGLARFET